MRVGKKIQLNGSRRRSSGDEWKFSSAQGRKEPGWIDVHLVSGKAQLLKAS